MLRFSETYEEIYNVYKELGCCINTWLALAVHGPLPAACNSIKAVEVQDRA